MSAFVRGRSTLKYPVCCFLPLCAISQGLSVPYQFLEHRNKEMLYIHTVEFHTVSYARSKKLNSVAKLPEFESQLWLQYFLAIFS